MYVVLESGIGICIDVVDRSIAIILDNPVTSSHSKEAFVFGVERLHLLGLNRQFGCHLIFNIFVIKLVKDRFFLDFPVVEEKVEGRLADWNHVL